VSLLPLKGGRGESETGDSTGEGEKNLTQLVIGKKTLRGYVKKGKKIESSRRS